jgi:excisionase family DNA binding protein
VSPTSSQDSQRQALLRSLFGPDVPRGLTGQLLRTSDVAALFQVSERTVSEWARRRRIPSVRTPGGHRRYPAEQIRDLLDETGALAADPADRIARPDLATLGGEPEDSPAAQGGSGAT